MKVLAFSDLHRDTDAATALLKASADASIVVGAGDFATKGQGASDTLEILANCKVPVLLVHGNHDDPDELATFCDGFENLHYLHGQTKVIEGVSFFGLGGEIPSRNDFLWNAAETETDASKLLERCPRNAVMITHTPPLGIADLQKDGEHEGSGAIRNALLETTPQLVLCGHIHHAWGTDGREGATYVRNLGPTANWFDV